MSNDPTHAARTATNDAHRALKRVVDNLHNAMARGHDGSLTVYGSDVATLESALQNLGNARTYLSHLHDDLNGEDGYLSTELLTVLSLSIIPVSIVVVWVAKMAGMVAGIS